MTSVKDRTDSDDVSRSKNVFITKLEFIVISLGIVFLLLAPSAKADVDSGDISVTNISVPVLESDEIVSGSFVVVGESLASTDSTSDQGIGLLESLVEIKYTLLFSAFVFLSVFFYVFRKYPDDNFL